MFTYFFLFFFLIVLKLLFRTEKNYLFLVGLILVIFCGFRGSKIDFDYQSYVLMLFKTGAYAHAIIEPTLEIMSFFVREVFNDTLPFFLLYAVIGVTLKLVCIKFFFDSNYELIFLGVLVYFSHFFLLHEMTQVRIGVGICFGLIAILYLYEKKYISFILYVFLGTTFHFSIVLFLILGFIRNTKSISKWWYLFTIFSCYLLYFFNITFTSVISIINQYILHSNYISSKMLVFEKMQQLHILVKNNNVFRPMFLVNMAISILILYHSDYIYSKFKYIYLALKMYLFSFITFILFSDAPIIADRISELFGIVEIILIPCIYFIIKQKYLAKIIVTSYCLLYLIILLLKNDLLKPYTF